MGFKRLVNDFALPLNAGQLSEALDWVAEPDNKIDAYSLLWQEWRSLDSAAPPRAKRIVPLKRLFSTPSSSAGKNGLISEACFIFIYYTKLAHFPKLFL